ncbi:hypothetical protein ACFQPA_09870 [Halomarina halobia]|uniref:Uncharacterized protein n=1 Tax=Halomarina halobia TaxID=3033386 RepID=A0ABD6AAK5_9EURY|nr:hypothetical protein [Halomarina sp. PSR21]
MADTSSPRDVGNAAAANGAGTDWFSSIARRVGGFVVLMVGFAVALEFLISIGVLDDTEMNNVFIGIALSLAILTVLTAAVAFVVSAVRRAL